MTRLEALEAVAKAARMRWGHNDTCGAALGEYECNCGRNALAIALEALDASEVRVSVEPTTDGVRVVVENAPAVGGGTGRIEQAKWGGK
jgi:predicted RNA methylase